jgi:hypothetical protein
MIDLLDQHWCIDSWNDASNRSIIDASIDGTMHHIADPIEQCADEHIDPQIIDHRYIDS